MEYIEKIFDVAKIIYSLCNEVKMNHKRCCRLKGRIESLLEPVKAIQKEDMDDSLTKLLKEMMGILESARDCIKSFTNKHRFSKVFKAFAIKEEFNHLNERLNDAAIALDLALHTEQTKMLLTIFKGNQRKKEDKQDTKEDQTFLNLVEKKLEEALHSMEERIQQAVETVNDDLGEMKMDLKDIKRIIEAYQEKPSVHPVQGILELSPGDIERESKPFLITDNSKYYKGTLHKFPVAIKRFVNVGPSSVEEIRKIFHKEAETMKHFESPNIVRIYGICIDQRSSSPEFLIAMEYCELGSLRSVLAGKWHLSWQSRVHMALDAASGLYRLHQSTEKFKLLCSIDSTRFLVDNGLRVKLGGMDLAKTETSIRRISASSQKSQLLPYISPQQMSDINYPYDKPCEVYSFGIVLWEIASCKTPFKDCSDQEIHQKVCEEQVREPLPSDCPKDLCELIDECRAFDPFERPNAGAIVDRLKNILTRITEATKEARD
ncbi:mixed lineage kinase domain-like protein isoform X2 [Pristis pectinata]|nr:mixed lineage kinase domain-like protein isoform X2 [Pristis pectinata]XP_051884268.1 mixed lineage kinase domain-like protein isoform X2 [Pristis pectinata]XP_051884269.1 mixed lineage kinase domain-like protein isoform X2 [Pristis pectinata]XP_051884270.1 mixed lineage kinase domain-like protein isoform X2 [Pristis pectinata]